MFSFHLDRDNIGDATCYALDFLSVDTLDMARVAKCAEQFAWAPGVYKNGRRLERCFERADLIGLDFDDGRLTLAQAVKTFCDAEHVIGTTKSHRINGNGDRFRVVLKLDDTVRDMATYKATLAHYITKYEADENAGSASRFFWPCREIVSVCTEGFTQEVVQAPPHDDGELPEYTGARVVPRWVDGYLRFGVPKGNRNKTCYRIGIHLTLAGFTMEEIIALVCASKIDLPQNELKRATRNGIVYGRMELARDKEEGAEV